MLVIPDVNGNTPRVSGCYVSLRMTLVCVHFQSSFEVSCKYPHTINLYLDELSISCIFWAEEVCVITPLLKCNNTA